MSRGPTVYRGIQGKERRRTDKAILFAITRTEGAPVDLIWFPLSQLASIHISVHVNKLDTLMVSEWILGEKGLLSISHAKNPALESAVVAPDIEDDKLRDETDSHYQVDPDSTIKHSSEYPDIPF